MCESIYLTGNVIDIERDGRHRAVDPGPFEPNEAVSLSIDPDIGAVAIGVAPDQVSWV